MEKTTSIFGKLSLVIIILMVATTANAKKPKSVASIFGKRINMGVYNPINANEWSVVATDQQNLNVQQVTGLASTASIVIKNALGEVIYTGLLKDGSGNINISDIAYGRYGIYIKNKDAEKIYKLLIQ